MTYEQDQEQVEGLGMGFLFIIMGSTSPWNALKNFSSHPVNPPYEWTTSFRKGNTIFLPVEKTYITEAFLHFLTRLRLKRYPTLPFVDFIR